MTEKIQQRKMPGEYNLKKIRIMIIFPKVPFKESLRSAGHICKLSGQPSPMFLNGEILKSENN